MFGRTRLRVEPRLDGVVVVEVAGEAGGWLGRRVPWASVRMRGALVHLVDHEGRELRSEGGGGLRAVWRREGMARVAEGAGARALRRELAAGTVDRVYRTESPVGPRVLAGVIVGLAGLCVTGAVMPVFGVSMLFPLGPAPTGMDRVLAGAVWVAWLVMLAVYLCIVGPAAMACGGRLRVTARGLELADTSGRVRVWGRESLGAVRASFAVEIVDREGNRTRVTQAPGLAAAIRELARAWFPEEAAEERAAVNRTLVRAAVIWVVGCIGVGVAMVWTGEAPRTLVSNATLNVVLLTAISAVAVPALVWVSVEGRRRLEPWLGRRLARSWRAGSGGGHHAR